MIAKQFFFEGKVQGVGFRYTTKQIAMGFEVVGWVRNLPDGRVEMQVMGDEDEVAEFLQDLHDSQLGSHIRHEEEHEIPPLENVRGFSIS